jgi:catechol 2,3-dioxygenase-like lactoylglutathione lyase family enzyme
MNYPILVELHVSDLLKAREFYSSLGYHEVRREDRYLVLSKGEALLHFYLCASKHPEHHYFKRKVEKDPASLGIGVEIIIFSAELDQDFAAMYQRGAVKEGIKARPWGVRDFRVADPFGYYLRVSEPYDTRADWTASDKTQEV